MRVTAYLSIQCRVLLFFLVTSTSFPSGLQTTSRKTTTILNGAQALPAESPTVKERERFVLKDGNMEESEIIVDASRGKRQMLKKLKDIQKEGRGVVKLSVEEYLDLVLGGSKGYHLIVLFTVGDRRMCPKCEDLTIMFEELTNQFRIDDETTQAQGLKLGLEGSGVTGDSARRPKENRLLVWGLNGSGEQLIFCVFDILQDRRIASLHDIRGVPAIVSITDKHTGEAGRGIGSNGQQVLFREENIYRSSGSFDGISNVFDWVNMKTKRKVKVQTSLKQKLQQCTIIIFLLFVLALVVWFGVLLLGRYPFLLVLGGLCVQVVGTSGLFYSLQFGMSLSGFNSKSNKLEWFSPSNRSQYLGEGILMSVATILCGLTLLAAAQANTWRFLRGREPTTIEGKKAKSLLVKNKSSERKCLGGSEGEIEGKRRGLGDRFVAQVVILLCGALFVGLLVYIFHIYKYKAQWYSPGFFPPADYVRGHVRIDRGYKIL